jgi:exodeoxyribonuclease V alpha subunit
VGLYNGDIGLVLPSRLEPRTLVAVFPVVRLDPATGDIQVEAREVPLPRLPPHEDALVLTVHKGQGSQYAHVAVVLADSRSPIQTRELVYTGITRASERVSWLGDEEALRTALQRRVQRGSALAWRLRRER